MKTDNQISKEYKALKIEDVAKKIGLESNKLYNFGPYITKIDNSIRGKEKGKLVLITSTSPNRRGVGKTTVAIGLADALNEVGKKSIVCVREPSLGPVFGLKGGACGGGFSQIYPIDDINLHFTGDIHAVTTLNNFIASAIDNHLHQGNELNINKEQILFKRCIDINDRTLRDITIAQGKEANGIERKDGFTITAASEIMAILGLCSDLEDFTNRVEDIIIGYDNEGKEIKVKELNIRGTIAVLMKRAINPNLVQTLNGNPAFIHAGPFANIAHGTNSIMATKMALSLSEYTVVEAGFGSDLGAEKFLDFVSKVGDFEVNHVVVVTTIPSLKEYSENEDLTQGINNLKLHLEHLKQHNVSFTITLNQHLTDTEEEVEFVKGWIEKHEYSFAINDVYAQGKLGGIDLANEVINSMSSQSILQPLYNFEDDIETKLLSVVTKAYGATGYNLSQEAKEQLEIIRNSKYAKYPVCFSKTPMSLSDDANNKLLLEYFQINITAIKVYAGAKFIVVYCGNVLTMPGLGKVPNATKIKYDFTTGDIEGLS